MIIAMLIAMVGILAITIGYDANKRARHNVETAVLDSFMKNCGTEFEQTHGRRMNDKEQSTAYFFAYKRFFTGERNQWIFTKGGEHRIRGVKHAAVSEMSPEGKQAGEASRTLLAGERLKNELHDSCPETVRRFLTEER